MWRSLTARKCLPGGADVLRWGERNRSSVQGRSRECLGLDRRLGDDGATRGGDRHVLRGGARAKRSSCSPSSRAVGVVVDLREVTFIDSSGLGAIIALYHRAGAAHARLQLVCGDVTLRLVRLMHLDEVMDVVTEPADASNGSVTSADVQPSDPG